MEEDQCLHLVVVDAVVVLSHCYDHDKIDRNVLCHSTHDWKDDSSIDTSTHGNRGVLTGAYIHSESVVRMRGRADLPTVILPLLDPHTQWSLRSRDLRMNYTNKTRRFFSPHPKVSSYLLVHSSTSLGNPLAIVR